MDATGFGLQGTIDTQGVAHVVCHSALLHACGDTHHCDTSMRRHFPARTLTDIRNNMRSSTVASKGVATFISFVSYEQSGRSRRWTTSEC